MPDLSKGFAAIEHFFVLMLENRSFDHMFGYAAALGTQPLTGREFCPADPARPSAAVPVTPNGPEVTDPDPPHEFHDVRYQLTGLDSGDRYADGEALTMNGFAASASYGPLRDETTSQKAKQVAARLQGQYALQCQGPHSVSVLRQLAAEFAVCDRWHASMPGPTWPNRFFVHAASSGGLDNSPSAPRSAAAVFLNRYAFSFEGDTVYDRLGKDAWRIYHADHFPQVLAVESMVKRRCSSEWQGHFRGIEQLRTDLQEPVFIPKYVFIEPDHGTFSHARSSNSQHPPGRVSAGEALIKYVYEAIRHSPHWGKSALIITYDEHGGFFDRAPPPLAEAPGDKDCNHDKAKFPAAFDFKLLGVRVPAVIISPWIKAATIEHTLFDHTSILKTLGQRFDFAPLTKRDAAAQSFAGIFSLTEPREDCSWQVEPSGSEEQVSTIEPVDSSDELSLSGTEAGVLRIAMTIDHLLNAQNASMLSNVLHYAASVRPQYFARFALTRAPLLTDRASAEAYLNRVAEKLGLPVEQSLGLGS